MTTKPTVSTSRQGSIPNRSIRIPDDEWQAAQEAARANGETVSEVVRRALRRYGQDTERT